MNNIHPDVEKQLTDLKKAILEDLETLTDMAPSKYKIRINDEEYAADEEVLKQHIILSPSEYKKVKENEAELNEMREIALS